VVIWWAKSTTRATAAATPAPTTTDPLVICEAKAPIANMTRLNESRGPSWVRQSVLNAAAAAGSETAVKGVERELRDGQAAPSSTNRLRPGQVERLAQHFMRLGRPRQPAKWAASSFSEWSLNVPVGVRLMAGRRALTSVMWVRIPHPQHAFARRDGPRPGTAGDAGSRPAEGSRSGSSIGRAPPRQDGGPWFDSRPEHAVAVRLSSSAARAPVLHTGCPGFESRLGYVRPRGSAERAPGSEPGGRWFESSRGHHHGRGDMPAAR
jgi:hypothetical protein